MLEKQLKSLEKKKEKLFEAFEEEIISKEDFSERMVKLNREKESIVERITTLKIDNKDSEPVMLEMVASIMKSFYEVFNTGANREQWKQLIHIIIKEITVDKDRNIDNIRV